MPSTAIPSGGRSERDGIRVLDGRHRGAARRRPAPPRRAGGSERQLDAIADGIVSTLRDERLKPIGREGVPASHWVLLDYGSVIVHIFTPPERDYYGLEKHWSEAKTVLRVQ